MQFYPSENSEDFVMLLCRLAASAKCTIFVYMSGTNMHCSVTVFGGVGHGHYIDRTTVVQNVLFMGVVGLKLRFNNNNYIDALDPL